MCRYATATVCPTQDMVAITHIGWQVRAAEGMSSANLAQNWSFAGLFGANVGVIPRSFCGIILVLWQVWAKWAENMYIQLVRGCNWQHAFFAPRLPLFWSQNSRVPGRHRVSKRRVQMTTLHWAVWNCSVFLPLPTSTARGFLVLAVCSM